MKVTVSVHGRYHAFELARGLHERQCLDRLLTTYPTFLARKWVGDNADIKSPLTLELRRRLYNRFGLGAKPDLMIARQFGEFAARHLKPSSDLFVGWSSASLEAIAPARGNGMRVIIERGSTHIVAQTQVLSDAYRSVGLAFTETGTEITERELAEYEQADYVSVPSAYAARTFVERGFAADRILINGLGVDVSRFQPPQSRPKDRLPRIVFAGTVGIRKGIPWLLQAFERLSGRAELHLLGPVAPEFQDLLVKFKLANVHVRGAIPGDALAREYGRGDIFCLPSVEEGYGLVIPEAMACGLAIVTTHVVGAVDILTEGVDSLIVPAADAAALSDALERLIDDADLRQSMGQQALAAIQTGHRWEDYIQRTLLSYEKILATSV